MPEFAYGSGPPQSVPPMKPERLGEGVTLVRPLSRKGVGPGLIVLAPSLDSECNVDIQHGIPSLRMKWAEEGYCVVEIRPQASSAALKLAVTRLEECHECQPKEKIGMVCYDTEMWCKAATAIEVFKQRIVVAAIYTDAIQYPRLSSQASVPTIYHITGKPDTKLRKFEGSKIFEYGTIQTRNFPLPFHKDFHYTTEAVSHSRNLAFFKPIMGGPHFDLELLWDEHTYWEFEARDVENTMATMVEEPYVNHIPTITGGIGRKDLTEFYRNHFVFSNPDDTDLELVSRTTGIDRVVDEFIFKFTHDRQIDWLFPGVPPTYKYVEIPMTAVVNIRGDRLYHEHINWDSATALRQIGALPDTVTLVTGAHGSPNDTERDANGNGISSKNYEIRLPTTGADTVAKMRDKNSVESNKMFKHEIREV